MAYRALRRPRTWAGCSPGCAFSRRIYAAVPDGQEHCQTRWFTSTTELDVIYLDNHVLAINKPAGMLSQGDRTGDLDAIVLSRAYVEERFQKPGRAYLAGVHRLDRPVSGVLCFARTSKAAARLSQAFRERQAKKSYLALVQGRLEGSGRRQDTLLQTDGRSGCRTLVLRDGGERGGHGAGGGEAVGTGADMKMRGKVRPAALEWEAAQHYQRQSPGVMQTLVHVRVDTGRKHQIRHGAQLAAMGHPIVGDVRYGAETRLQDRSIMLHACSLVVPHPTTRHPLVLEAPLPQAWVRRCGDAVGRAAPHARIVHAGSPWRLR